MQPLENIALAQQSDESAVTHDWQLVHVRLGKFIQGVSCIFVGIGHHEFGGGSHDLLNVVCVPGIA
jgi:hypothetical protein